MAISIEKVVFNPFVLGLIGFALLSLSMKLNSKKILNLKLNPLAYVGFLLCLYFYWALLWSLLAIFIGCSFVLQGLPWPGSLRRKLFGLELFLSFSPSAFYLTNNCPL